MGHCLKSSRAEISRKKNCGSNLGLTGPNRDWNDLFCSNVAGRPIKLASLNQKNILHIIIVITLSYDYGCIDLTFEHVFNCEHGILMKRMHCIE